MSEHVTAWLGAYYDGELHGRRLRQVETHLAHCATCRAELKSLRALTTLLQESPVAVGLASPERFVARVGLRLPRHPERTAWQRTLEIGWRLAPLSLIGAWTFVQAVFAVSRGMLVALRMGLRGDLAAWLLTGFGALYLLWGVRRAIRNSPHTHRHMHDEGVEHAHSHAHDGSHLHVHSSSGRRSLTPWILFTIFLFGPCEPLIPLLMYPAAAENLWSVALVAGVFGGVTLLRAGLPVEGNIDGAPGSRLGEDGVLAIEHQVPGHGHIVPDGHLGRLRLRRNCWR